MRILAIAVPLLLTLGLTQAEPEKDDESALMLLGGNVPPWEFCLARIRT
jgi:hypothetical protein